MPFPDPFSQAQLEIAAGGTAALREIVDKGKTNTLSSPSCQAALAEIKRAAAGDIYSILQVPFDPNDPTFATADFVQQNAVTIGLYWTWHKSTGGLAIPEEVKAAYVDAVAKLKEARAALRSLGTSQQNAATLGSGQVIPGGGWGRGNFGGFC
jgi:hypothetical protein